MPTPGSTSPGPVGINTPGSSVGGSGAGSSGSLSGPQGATGATPSSASSLPGFFTLNTPDRLATLSGTASAQALGGPAATAPAGNVLGQIFTGALLSQVLGTPNTSGTNGGPASQNHLSATDPGNAASSVSSATDLRLSGDVNRMGVPLSGDSTPGVGGSLLTTLSPTGAAPPSPSPLQDSLTTTVAQPTAVSAGDPPPLASAQDPAGGTPVLLPSPQPIPEPAPLALFILVGVALTARAGLRRGKQRARRFVFGH